MCGLWCHKECGGISSEFVKFLEEQTKDTGFAYWACRRHESLAWGDGEETDSVEESSKNNKDNIAQMRKEVENIKERLERRMNTNKDVIFEEMRERKAKRLYIVMHGVQECNEKTKSRERGWGGARTRHRRYSKCWSLASLKKKSNTATGLVKK